MPVDQIKTPAVDQASKLRELMRRRERTNTIAILSGKGGVGKSNIAVNLSVYLAARGLKVALVDLDMGLANADLLLNLHPPYNLAHVIAGIKTIDEVATDGPCGLRLIPGGSGVHSLANLSEFERRTLNAQLDTLAASADITILDCGAGINRNVISFAASADQVLIITTPEPTALTDAYAVLKVLTRESKTISARLCLNMVRSRQEAEAAFRRVASVADKFLKYSIANGGYILHDRAVELAVRERRPFVIANPASNASVCLAAMGAELARCADSHLKRGGFFQRVAGLFV